LHILKNQQKRQKNEFPHKSIKKNSKCWSSISSLLQKYHFSLIWN
jgi:hypothetical protein